MLNHVHVYLCECFQTALVDVGTRLLPGVWRHLKPNHETWWPRADMASWYWDYWDVWLVSCFLGKSVSSLVFPHSSRIVAATEYPAECVRVTVSDDETTNWVSGWKLNWWRNWSVLHDSSCQNKYSYPKEKVAILILVAGMVKWAVAVQLGSGIAHCHLELGGWDWRGRVVTFNFGLMSIVIIVYNRKRMPCWEGWENFIISHNFTTSLGKWTCAESWKGVRIAMSRGIKPSMAPWPIKRRNYEKAAHDSWHLLSPTELVILQVNLIAWELTFHQMFLL